MRRVRFSELYGTSLAGPVPTGSAPIRRPSPGATTVPSLASALNQASNQEVMALSKELEREALLEQMEDIVQQGIEVEREQRREHARIAAPTARAGYVVAVVIGLLLFTFITHYIFGNNKYLTGALVVSTALFFIFGLRDALEKRGARTIGATAGAVTGL